MSEPNNDNIIDAIEYQEEQLGLEDSGARRELAELLEALHTAEVLKDDADKKVKRLGKKNHEQAKRMCEQIAQADEENARLHAEIDYAYECHRRNNDLRCETCGNWMQNRTDRKACLNSKNTSLHHFCKDWKPVENTAAKAAEAKKKPESFGDYLALSDDEKMKLAKEQGK